MDLVQLQVDDLILVSSKLNQLHSKTNTDQQSAQMIYTFNSQVNMDYLEVKKKLYLPSLVQLTSSRK